MSEWLSSYVYIYIYIYIIYEQEFFIFSTMYFECNEHMVLFFLYNSNSSNIYVCVDLYISAICSPQPWLIFIIIIIIIIIVL